MKKTCFTTFLLLMVTTLFTFAQTVSDSVLFNNYFSGTDNDLVNNFSNTSWISQSTSGGISGGSLTLPTSLSWGNDLIQYCKNYSNVLDSASETSICFHYNSALINNAMYERAAAIFLIGDVINHNVAYYLNRDHTLSITTYGYAQNTLLTMTSGHWYKLTATYKSLSGGTGDMIYARAEIFDLGVNGTSAPTAVGNHTATIHDSDLVNSAKFDVKVCGAQWGGSDALDNFYYKGITGTNNCTMTATEYRSIPEENIFIYPLPASEAVHIELPSYLKEKIVYVKLFDGLGKLRMSEDNILKENLYLSLKNLLPGIYFVEIKTDKYLWGKKIMIQ